MDIVKKIITDFLIALYKPFWLAIVLSVFFMYMRKNYSSVKEAVKKRKSCKLAVYIIDPIKAILVW